MSPKVKNLFFGGSFFLVLLLAFLPAIGLAQITIDIQVSPNVLNLQNNGQVVTVHTDIAYSTVDGSSVSLNGVEINSWKSDNQGNFVAKFLIEEIKDLPLNVGGMNTLELEGETYNSETFYGVDEIRVINVVPKGKK